MQLIVDPRMLISSKTGDPASNGAIVTEWKQNDGEIVRSGEVVALMKTDYYKLQLIADAGGRLRHVAKLGQRLTAGAVICLVEPVLQGNPVSGRPSANQSQRLIDLAHQLFQ